MEVNKDEAERCIELAEEFINENNREEAEKFLLKAQRLYPSSRGKILLERVYSMTLPRGGERQSRRRMNSKKERPISHSYSARELYETIKRIRNCKDYYEMLSVSKTATDLDIRKAYKKLALLLHPDKNKSPSAVEAFKSIVNAVTVLTDPHKRKQYDKRRLNEEKIPKSYYSSPYTRGFESDSATDEFFNSFSNFEYPNMFTRGNCNTPSGPDVNNVETPNHQQEQVQPPESGLIMFFQILPILLAICLSMTSSIFISDPAYSLQQTAKYSVAQETKHLHLPYYVKESFKSEHHVSVERLEAVIEEEYLTTLTKTCYKEKNYRDSMMWKAKNFGDEYMFEQAKNIPVPSCEKLQGVRELLA